MATYNDFGDEPKPVIYTAHIDKKDMVADVDEALQKHQPVQMKSSLDNLSVWKAAGTYKRVALVCFLAAFSAALDGYQVNLNGSIVANKGFIRTMSPGLKAVAAKYVSVWGGIQAAGQVVGQVLLQFVSDAVGRRIALLIIWVTLVVSIIIECVANDWRVWLVAKLFAGMGVGAMQGTLPMYIAEQSPTQLRGFLINAYTFWFVVGQLLAPVALRELNATRPYDFRIAIYTQWGMIGLLAIIWACMPESPWWLVSKGRLEKAEKVLLRHNGHIEHYDVNTELGIMVATVEEERRLAIENKNMGLFSVLRGQHGWRLLIASWPKVTQQFVGLSVFNSYSTYFFQLAGNKNPFTVTVILACVQLISVLLTMAFTDSYGRRPITVYGYMVTVVAVLCLGIVGCFHYQNGPLGSLLIFFACLAIFSTTGASAIGYAYLAEIPTQRLRARIAGWGLAFSNLWSIMFSFTVPLMLAKWGPKAGFFFAGTGTIVCAIGWFILPEVARRTPAEIDEMFEKKVPPRKFKGYVTDVQRNLAEVEKQQMAGVGHDVQRQL